VSGEFLAALDKPLDSATFNAVKDKDSYTCVCGLSIGISVDKLASTSSILRNPALLRDAHSKHHKEHYGVKATLYMQGEVTPPGNNTIVAAWCSCDYEVSRPDLFVQPKRALDA
jgi:hypothetical protein